MNQRAIHDAIWITRFVECEKQIGPAEYDGFGASFVDKM
jgi:hypothetical protein